MGFPRLVQKRLQAVDSIHNRRLQRPPLHAQGLGGLRVVHAGHLVPGRQVAARGVLGGQLVAELGEAPPHDVEDGAVAVEAGGGEEAAAAELGPLDGGDVGLGDVAHVDPVDVARVGQDAVGRAPAALDEGDDALVGRVDAVEAGEVVDDGAKDQGGVDRDQVELGRLAGLVGVAVAGVAVLDKVPGGPLGQRLGGAVGHGRVGVDVGEGDGVPRGLGEGGGRVGQPGGVQDGGEGRGDDDAADGGGGAGDGAEEARGAVDGGVDEVFLGVVWEGGYQSLFFIFYSCIFGKARDGMGICKY